MTSGIAEREGNVVGALALALSDALLDAAGDEAPSATPAAAIAAIGHAPGVSIGELGRALGLSHPGSVRLVDRLESNALVSRARSARDGRSVELMLTATGRRVCRRILSARGSTLDRALGALSAADRRTFSRIAETMLRALLIDGDHAFRVCRLCDPVACTRCPVETEFRARADAEPG